MGDFIPIFADWIEVTGQLSDQEKGRLIDAIVLYARGECWQERIKGNERFVFPSFKGAYDRHKEIREKRAEAGKRGGEQTQANSSKREQTQANSSKSEQTEANSSKFKQTQASPTDKDNNKNIDYNSPYNPPTGDDGGGDFFRKIRAMNVPLSADAYEEVRDFMDQGISDSMLSYAVDLAADQNRLSWAYIRGIVNRWITEGVETLQQAKARKREEPEEDDPFANVYRFRADVNPYRD